MDGLLHYRVGRLCGMLFMRAVYLFHHYYCIINYKPYGSGYGAKRHYVEAITYGIQHY